MPRRIILPLLAALAVSGCLDDSTSSIPQTGPQGPAAFTVHVGPINAAIAARNLSADAGGMLFVEVSNATKAATSRDSSVWTGNVSTTFNFPALVEGSGYVVRAWYRDPQGFTTHGDSVGGLRLARGENASVTLALRAMLGKIILTAPALPASIDTISMAWTSPSASRRTVAVRGSGGRTILRLDSLPIGVSASLRLRAWNASRDTLFHLDTSVKLSSDHDLPLSLSLQSSRGTIATALGFRAGGEIDATASFAGEADQPTSQTGRLLLVAFSDSGAADWIGIHNPRNEPFSGRVRLGKGSSEAQFALSIPAGEDAVVTRAPCAAIDSLHPLHGAAYLVCGIDEITVTHSTSGGSLWKLRDADGTSMLDEVLVLDGKQSWPDLNTSSARTARLRADWKSATSNDAGRAWCADGSDSPSDTCH